MKATHFAVPASTSLPLAGVAAAYNIAGLLTLSRDATTDALSVTIPDNFVIEALELHLANNAGASTIQVTLYDDAACDHPIYETVAAAWVTGITTVGDLATVWAIARPWTRSANSTAGTLYMLARTDAGTIDITSVRLYWTTGD